MEVLEMNLVQITVVQKTYLTRDPDPKWQVPYNVRYERHHYPGGYVEWRIGSEEETCKLEPSKARELEQEFQAIFGG